MHICFVEIGYPRPTTGVVGGAGTYVKLIATQLVKKGYEISVICGRVKNNLTYYNDGDINVYPVIEYGPLHYYISKIPILNIFSKLVRYLETGFKIYRMLCIINYKNKIDLVEYSEGGDFWNRYTKKFKYISHLHGSAYTFKNNSGQNVDLSDWLHRIAEHYFIKNSKEVISPSNAMVELVESEIGKVFQNVNVIPYPIDEYQIVKSQNKKSPGEKYQVNLFFAARNDPVKGGEILINALKRLPDILISQIKVDFYGFKPKQDTSKLKFLNIKEFVPKKVLDNAYNKADICVIPSIFDNSPNTVYEAMAYGKIVVASKVGGIPEIINSVDNGLLFDPQNINDLVHTLIKAIELVLSGESEKMRMNAQKRISSFANLKENMNRRLALIDKHFI